MTPRNPGVCKQHTKGVGARGGGAEPPSSIAQPTTKVVLSACAGCNLRNKFAISKQPWSGIGVCLGRQLQVCLRCRHSQPHRTDRLLWAVVAFHFSRRKNERNWNDRYNTERPSGRCRCGCLQRCNMDKLQAGVPSKRRCLTRAAST